MTQRQRRTLWARKIEEQRGSGLSIKKWCQQQSIHDKTFLRWKRILRRESQTEAARSPQSIQPVFPVVPAAPEGWYQIKATPPAPMNNGLKLVVNDRITIELQSDCDRQLLQEVLAVICR